jgi:LEA14-like dessication related protein
MNNGIKFLIGAAAWGLLYNFLNRKKAALENIGISNIDVAIDLPRTQNANYIKLFYKLKIRLVNTANASINIKSIDANFFLNGIEFANISQNINALIPAGASKEINITASINSGNIIASIIDIISENKAEIEVQGSLMTDLGLIEFQQKKIV